MAAKTVGFGVVGISAVLLAISSVYLNPIMTTGGFFRPVENFKTGNCVVDESLKACEKIVLHRPSGLLYMSCSEPQARRDWCPALEQLTKPKPPADMDYFALVDTSKGSSFTPGSHTRVKLVNLPTSDPKWRGLNLVGLDVVPSNTESGVLWVYVINHRPRLPPRTAELDGADSSVEIFRTEVGSDTFKYVRTVEDLELIVTPNDVVGQPDGSGFWVTNDHFYRTGHLKRLFENLFQFEGHGITYCDNKEGCRNAISGLPNLNGVSRATRQMQEAGQDFFYAAGDGLVGNIYVMERQSDNSLVLTDTVKVGYGIDNIHVEPDGTLYAATFPRPSSWLPFGRDPENVLNPSSVHKISIDPQAFFGDKYRVEKIFESDGHVISGATTAVWNSKDNVLWINGVMARGLVACKLH